MKMLFLRFAWCPRVLMAKPGRLLLRGLKGSRILPRALATLSFYRLSACFPLVSGVNIRIIKIKTYK